ncbi:MAG TPA: type II toxin-antitoxin system VapC family toxin [Bryobacteraceae bacterium]|nr:type II toxin-antitoxin system VapC family toxin [Bryobacteraceae bacterium]
MHEGLRLKTSGGFLLDKNILLWILLNRNEKISRRALKIVKAAEPDLHVSIVSIWEILVKRHAGKLMVAEDPDTIIETVRSQEIWRILPLAFDHLSALNTIDRSTDHTDLFDRMLIAQARAEGLRIVTADEQFSRYDVDVVW